MSLWKRSKRKDEVVRAADSGQVQRARTSSSRSPAVAMEVDLLAIEALENGAVPRSFRSPRRVVRTSCGIFLARA